MTLPLLVAVRRIATLAVVVFVYYRQTVDVTLDQSARARWTAWAGDSAAPACGSGVTKVLMDQSFRDLTSGWMPLGSTLGLTRIFHQSSL